MKASIFNMTFTLPPMLEITEVEKELPGCTFEPFIAGCGGVPPYKK